MQRFEPDMPRYVHDAPKGGGRHVTANVTLWPLFDVLFANPARLASLTGRQRGCATGTQADLAALRQAFTPVCRSLGADAQTGAFIRQIRQLKRTSPPGPAPGIPAGCAARH